MIQGFVDGDETIIILLNSAVRSTFSKRVS